MLAWRFHEGSNELEVFDVDDQTHQLVFKQKLKFSKKVTQEDARKFFDDFCAKSADDVRVAADSIGHFRRTR